MKIRTLKFSVTVVVAIAAAVLYAAEMPVLKFYFVSTEAKPGWRRFDSTTFPNLGYIANRPDLLVARVKNAYVHNTLQSSTIVHADGSRETTEELKPTLVITFFPDDAKALYELTTAHLGERMLFLLGDEALFAPVIRERIDDPSMSIVLPVGTNPDKIKTDLEKLSGQEQ
jgi:hypothetical protein